jgi:hypothetical protein
VTLAVGARLGPYEIVAPLGAGGMRTVPTSNETKNKNDLNNGAGSLVFHERDVSFSGFATIALIPGLNGASQTVLRLDGVPYTSSA